MLVQRKFITTSVIVSFKDIQHLFCPQNEGLGLDDILEWGSQKQEIDLFLPDQREV